MVKVPEVVVRKTIRKVKGSTDIDQQIDEVHELLAQATIKLKGLEERKKEKKKRRKKNTRKWNMFTTSGGHNPQKVVVQDLVALAFTAEVHP